MLNISAWPAHPPDIDPINFISALHHYDVSSNAPHAPGYPLYVGLAWLAQHIVETAHAYQFVNLAMLISTSLLGFFWFGNDRIPQPLYRLTHNYFKEKDATWDRLEAAVTKARADQLIVYRDWPGVSNWALRLMRPDGIFAVQKEDGQFQLNDNGKWLPVGQGNLGRYKSTLILTNENDEGHVSQAGPPLKPISNM